MLDQRGIGPDSIQSNGAMHLQDICCLAGLRTVQRVAAINEIVRTRSTKLYILKNLNA